MNKGEIEQKDSVKHIIKTPKNDFVKSLLGNDRKIKELSLKKVKDHMDRNNYKIYSSISVAKKDKYRDIKIIKNDRGLIGYIDKNNKFIDKKNFLQIDKYMNLKEVLSEMMENGDNLSFICEKNNIKGIMRFKLILKEIEN